MAGTLLGLDIGNVRTGIAIAREPVYIPTPLETVATDGLEARIQKLLTTETVHAVVVGLPRNMSGNETAQTAYVQSIVKILQQTTSIPFIFTDEAATSIKAEEELQRRGKPFEKGAVDMLAAVFILEDYIQEHPEAIRV